LTNSALTNLLYRCYGNRKSLAARKRDRLAICFESFEGETAEQTARTTCVRKSPVGNFENMAWDKEALVLEVNG
jgi:hypothetical protein